MWLRDPLLEKRPWYSRSDTISDTTRFLDFVVGSNEHSFLHKEGGEINS